MLFIERLVLFIVANNLMNKIFFLCFDCVFIWFCGFSHLPGKAEHPEEGRVGTI